MPIGFDNNAQVYTATSSGDTIGTSNVYKSFAIQVVSTDAAATAWNVVLEGSLDSVNFTTILTHTQATGDKAILFSGATLFPVKYFRSRVNSITLGSATNIVVYIIGVQ